MSGSRCYQSPPGRSRRPGAAAPGLPAASPRRPRALRWGLLACGVAVALGCRREERPAAASAPGTAAGPAADAAVPWPTGFEFADLTARVAWRASVLASGKLDAATQASVARGEALFLRTFGAADGLGPSFNDVSCVACHGSPAPLGRGGMSQAARVHGRGEKGAFGQEFPFAGTRLAPQHQLPGTTAQPMPEGFVFMGLRLPPPLAGLGWIEAVQAAQIFAGRHCPEPEPPPAAGTICGWAPAKNAGAGTLRFGYKMVTATIDEFVTSAFANEMGLTTVMPMRSKDDDGVPDLEISNAQVIDVANYIAFSAPPGQPLPPAHAGGVAQFERAGCKGCHWGTFTVGGKPAPQMYSDLLAHDLGPALAETRRDELTPAGHYRTAPLWGLRHHRGPYLRDGRAATLHDAIALHGGEASAARDAYLALEPAAREALLAMLGAL